ncbi:unnamed protein product [Schistosoma mattheei]|uniref:Uncharacterized protein n=1 Tax=Schistosoma mattheei TaxID=31246 RepID=A0A183PUU7_9TREM|nr:unnamed protein product [Schistosoma mattheei]
MTDGNLCSISFLKEEFYLINLLGVHLLKTRSSIPKC